MHILCLGQCLYMLKEVEGLQSVSLLIRFVTLEKRRDLDCAEKEKPP